MCNIYVFGHDSIIIIFMLHTYLIYIYIILILGESYELNNKLCNLPF